MNAHTNPCHHHSYGQRARKFGSPRPGSERICRLVDQLAKIFIAGVPALALIAAVAWAVNLTTLVQWPVMAVGIRMVAILITVPAAIWLYKAIADLKERGLA